MIRVMLPIFFLSILVFSCSPEKDPLIGRWQVVSVNRGGDVIGGPSFTGTVFEFGEDGVVHTSNPNEEREVRYKRDGQYLIYEADAQQERYRIDSLSDKMLIIFSDADGIPTTTGMKRLDVEK